MMKRGWHVRIKWDGKMLRIHVTIFVHYICLEVIGSNLEHDGCHSEDVEYVLSNTPELHWSYSTTFHKVCQPAGARESSLVLSSELSCVLILIMMQGFIIL